MSLFAPAPEPKSALGYHRILSPTAGVRVSPLCLGGMNFGDAWEAFMGKCDKSTAFEILDYFYEQGGNFIDTANNYQNEQSEQWIGEWMQKRGNRDEMVIATKFTTGYRGAHRDKQLSQSNYQGNHTKSLHLSLHASLKKLQTDYVDVLYLHWWDYTTDYKEVMQSLNTLVQQGKVLYLGVSDTPAWVVARANEYARQNGMRQFSVFQAKWSSAERDLERDIIPLCVADGLAITPWNALGGGKFKTDEQRQSQDGRKLGDASESDIKVSKALEKVAKRKNTIITSVALAYVMHKTPNVFPIVGGRNLNHLKGNIEALSLKLTREDIEEIEAANSFDPGFPTSFALFGKPYHSDWTTSDMPLVNSNAHIDMVPKQGPIPPRAKQG